ncbi:hypothetical protein [Streptomyces sp. NPDC093970]|uniref:hypothetical protein n=1 Tax=Streptomyces sp. NPDC093970 TaxID=3155076 RepID=UPI00343140C7
MADRPSGTTGTAADADAPTGAIDAAGSGHPVRPGLPRESTATGGNATRFTVGLVAALTFTLLVVDYLRSGDAPVPEPLLALAPLAGPVSWGYTGRAYLHWTRPRRLLGGPEGLTAREAGGTDTVFDWPGIAAVTVATRPADEHPWLLVRAEPGRGFTRDRSYVHDGQEVYRVIRLDRMPGGAETVVPAVREWCTGRFGRLPEK